MMRTLKLRLRQLTLAALLVALLVPAGAATAKAAGSCATPLQTFTFVGVLPVVGLPGLPANQVATITTHECFVGSTATGTFVVTVGTETIGTGTLIAFHSGCRVAAFFAGHTVLNQPFSGVLLFNCGFGTTVVHFEDVGTVTLSFHCTNIGTTYNCLPTGAPVFVASDD
jgi:hypothetical protein